MSAADSAKDVVVALRPAHFTDSDTVLATFAGLTASTFRYSSGVAALRIANELGHLVLLPFQGQQIWDAHFLGRTLTMKSMFQEPLATDDYLSTYGAFFIHCGVTAMGNPGPTDTHPLHGELPNARYQQAALVAGTGADGPFMAVTGLHRHTVAFKHNYGAEPTVKLHANSSRIHLDLTVRNLKHTPMELLYLAHINFRPVDDAILVDTASRLPDRIRIRPAAPDASEAQRKLVDAVRANPDIHRKQVSGRMTGPELVLFMDCLADEHGWAHSMQVHPDGAADFVSHRPDELGVGARWIARTPDQDAMGLMLPATAEADGYAAEKAKGNVRLIPPQGTFRCRLEFGALTPDSAAALRRHIDGIMTVGRQAG
jgi:hypothetical protein